MKQSLIGADRKYFSGRLYLARQALQERRGLNQVKDISLNRFLLLELGQPSALDSLAERFGSDKGGSAVGQRRFDWPIHNYASVYSMLLGAQRDYVKLLFECGIGSTDTSVPSNMGIQGTVGASLRMWKSWLPQAEILGADVDPKCMLSEPGIRTAVVDQTRLPQVIQMWQNWASLGQVDIMIDDGLHTFLAAETLIEGSWPRLRAGGWYFIEDIPATTLASYISLGARYSTDLWAFASQRDGEAKIGDNCLLALRK